MLDGCGSGSGHADAAAASSKREHTARAILRGKKKEEVICRKASSPSKILATG
jgi:hypothetical protein